MAVRSLKDGDWTGLNNALRDLFAFKDQYTTQNLDFHGRQIKNASPAVDQSDYVVLSQLPTFSTTPAPFTKVTAGPGLTYDKITFGIANDSPAQIGTGFTPPYIWSNPGTGMPLVCFFAFNIAPTGANLIIDILKNGSTIFTSPITITPGSAALTATVKTNFVPSLSFKQKDIVTPSVIQVGSSLAGQGIEVVIICTL